MIPKILHHIWLTRNPLKQPELRLSFMRHHPLWSFVMWTPEVIARSDFSPSRKKAFLDEGLAYVARTDALRFEILYEYGGVYADTDMLCLKPLDPLIDGEVAFTSESFNGEMSNALLGCARGYQLAGLIAEKTTDAMTKDPGLTNASPHTVCGVKFQSPFIRNFGKVYPREYFYPFNYNDLSGRDKEWTSSYAAHQWHGMDPDGWVKERFV